MTDASFLTTLLLIMTACICIPCLIGLVSLTMPAVSPSDMTEEASHTVPAYPLHASFLLWTADLYCAALIIAGEMRGLGRVTPQITISQTIRAYCV